MHPCAAEEECECCGTQTQQCAAAASRAVAHLLQLLRLSQQLYVVECGGMVQTWRTLWPKMGSLFSGSLLAEFLRASLRCCVCVCCLGS